MATYRVPPAGGFPNTHTHAAAAPVSVTRGPGGAADPPGTRRPSVSNDSPPVATTGTGTGTGATNGMTNGMAGKPGNVAMAPLGASAAQPTVVKTTYAERHPEEVKQGWSRGRKICCGLLLLFIAILITLGVLIAFMVRMPSVDYKDYKIICANNDFLRCARDRFQVLVFLEVDNPNILGATINADLALYWEGEFVGPGVIEDTSVAKRGQTELQALFNITSAKGLQIAEALVVPPQRPVVLDVKGTVYVHVGLLRPSGQFEDRFTINPPNLSDLVNGAISGAEIPSTGDVADAITDQIPPDAGQTIVDAIPGVPSEVVDAIPDIPGLREVVAGEQQAPAGTSAGGSSSTTDPGSSKSSLKSPLQVIGLRTDVANPTGTKPRPRPHTTAAVGAGSSLLTPRQFVREMQKIGALPNEHGQRQRTLSLSHAGLTLARRLQRHLGLRSTQRQLSQ